MNKKLGIILIVVVVALGYWWRYDIDNKNSSEVEESKKVSPLEREVRNLLEKYPDINQEAGGNINYTFQYEDQIIKQGKPIVFTGQLDDVFRKDGKIYIRFSPSWLDYGLDGPEEYYTVSGCEEKISEMVNQKRSLYGDEYAVVAKIDSVKKPVLKIDTSGSGEDVELGYTSSDIFLITGQCIDLAFIENNE